MNIVESNQSFTATPDRNFTRSYKALAIDLHCGKFRPLTLLSSFNLQKICACLIRAFMPPAVSPEWDSTTAIACRGISEKIATKVRKFWN